MKSETDNKSYRLVRFHDNNKKSEIMHIGSGVYPRGWSSISPGFDTVEELREGEGIPEEPCKICGSIFGTRYDKPTKAKMLERHMCFTCNFWQNISERQTDRCLRIGGTHYTVSPDTNDRSEFKGFGGRKFKIRMLDGSREFETPNLWHQGEMPEYFQKLLPNNAEFVKA